MELVYLWVEDYKNIHEQGFNFSPRFRCKYDKDNNELTIEDNKDYIPDFFGENINVTAIVGKNGSGKSSVLFQEQGSDSQEFSINFKIIFRCNRFELLEPYINSWDEDGPFINVFRVQNKTNYEHILLTCYEYLNLYSNEKQYFTSGGSGANLDIDYSIYFNWDILKYFSLDEYYEMYGYGFTRDNPNILIPLIKDKNDNINYKFFLENLKEKINNFIEQNYYNDFFKVFDFQLKEVNTEGNDFFNLSHGERSLFILLFLILDKFFEEKKDLLIYLDEPDITLHPQWQKDLIKKIIIIFSDLGYKFHFILTTHSPFLLSDIPKQNIIFLNKDNNGNCIELPHGKVLDKKQTFGANIHTLLSDSFFMKGGLMGEFAKGKIEEVIKFLNDKESLIKDDSEAKTIIDIIGEPILQKKLEKMLERYREKNNLVDPQEIEQQIQELQEKLNRIKKDG